MQFRYKVVSSIVVSISGIAQHYSSAAQSSQLLFFHILTTYFLFLKTLIIDAERCLSDIKSRLS